MSSFPSPQPPAAYNRCAARIYVRVPKDMLEEPEDMSIQAAQKAADAQRSAILKQPQRLRLPR